MTMIKAWTVCLDINGHSEVTRGKLGRVPRHDPARVHVNLHPLELQRSLELHHVSGVAAHGAGVHDGVVHEWQSRDRGGLATGRVHLHQSLTRNGRRKIIWKCAKVREGMHNPQSKVKLVRGFGVVE